MDFKKLDALSESLVSEDMWQEAFNKLIALYADDMKRLGALS